MTEDDDMINIRWGKFLAVPENMVHHPLERGWGIVQAKGHHLKLEEAKGSGKGALLPGAWCQIDLPLTW